MTTNFFSPLFCCCFLDPGSGMGKNQDPGSGINIPDPQHCILYFRIRIQNFLEMLVPDLYINNEYRSATLILLHNVPDQVIIG